MKLKYLCNLKSYDFLARIEKLSGQTSLQLLHLNLYTNEERYSRLTLSLKLKQFTIPTTHHMSFTSKRSENDRFQVILTWNTRGVFVEMREEIQFTVW